MSGRLLVFKSVCVCFFNKFIQKSTVSNYSLVVQTVLCWRFCLRPNFFSRFLLKKNKTPGEADGGEVIETVTLPTSPVAKETTPSSSSQPDPAPSGPETSPARVPTECSDQDCPMETLPTPTPVCSTSALPVQQEEVPNPQNAVQPKVSPVGREIPENDGEEAGPSGLNSHSSSASCAPSAPFIPFSGGGQRLGSLGLGAAGHPRSSALSSSSLTAAVESPKAKKAKPSCSSSAKVSY